MGQLIAIPGLGFWLLLGLTPGITMLVCLVVHLWRAAAKPVRPVEPRAKGEPVGLDLVVRDAVDQLNVASTALSRFATVGPSLYEEPGTPTRLPVPTHGTSGDRDFVSLVDKMYQLAELTSDMLEKKKLFKGTTVDPLSAAGNPTPSRSYVSFRLDGERFAVSTSSVDAVVEGGQLITHRTKASTLRRAIRSGNTLVPVIDLGAHLIKRPLQMSWSSCVVILKVGRGERMQMIGVAVDAIGNMLDVSPLEIELPGTSDSKVRNDFILGTASVNSHTFFLLDIERGFSANEFVLPLSVTQPSVQEPMPT